MSEKKIPCERKMEKNNFITRCGFEFFKMELFSFLLTYKPVFTDTEIIPDEWYR